MASHDPPTSAILLCQLADVMDVHRLGRVADVEMQVDVDIVFTSKLEDSADLADRVGVVARGATDHAGPAFQTLDKELVSARIIGQAVLGKDTNLDVDRPNRSRRLATGPRQNPRMPIAGSTST